MAHLWHAKRLRQDFNQWSDAVRVISVVSPTCPNCLEGYELVSRTPAGPTSLVLWTAMLDGDSTRFAFERIGSDRRSTHYWEGEGWPVSTRLRPVLGLGTYNPEMSAWDVYLLFPPGVVWTDEDPPLPLDWTHNLRENEPDRPRITRDLLIEWSSRELTLPPEESL